MTRYVYTGLSGRPTKPMTASAAAKYNLSESDPEALAKANAEMMAELVGILADKGLLLPSEVVKVLGPWWSAVE